MKETKDYSSGIQLFAMTLFVFALITMGVYVFESIVKYLLGMT